MKYFNFPNKLITAISILFLSLFFSSCASNTSYSKTGFYFDTIVEITIYDSVSKDRAEDILSTCMNQCAHYESLFSRTLSGSDIYNVNNSSKKDIYVDHETAILLDKALLYAQISDGLADPTIGSLTPLWDISSSFTPASDNDIQNALSKVDYHNVSVDLVNNIIWKASPDVSIDLGFIAKGYIADSLKKYLEDENINSAIINLGGNVLCVGQKPDGSSFRIGIKNPVNPNSTPLTTVDINNQSVVSSGDYERSVIINDKKYHHIISTKNGYPVDNDLSEVTIINDSSLEGDALSTICFILGSEEAVNFLENNYPSVKYIFVNKDGNIIARN